MAAVCPLVDARVHKLPLSALSAGFAVDGWKLPAQTALLTAKGWKTKQNTIFTHFSYIFLSFWALGAAESSPLCWAGSRLLSRVGKKCSHCSRPGHHHYLHCKHFITQWTTEKQGCWIKLHKHLDSFSIYRSVGTTVSKQALWLMQNLCRFNVFKVSGDTQS